MKVLQDTYNNNHTRRITLSHNIIITITPFNIIYYIDNLVISCSQDVVLINTPYEYYICTTPTVINKNLDISKYRIRYYNIYCERYFPWLVYDKFIIEVYNNNVIITHYDKEIIARTCYSLNN